MWNKVSCEYFGYLFLEIALHIVLLYELLDPETKAQQVHSCGLQILHYLLSVEVVLCASLELCHIAILKYCHTQVLH